MSRDIEKQIVKYLQDAHAMEMQSVQMLEAAVKIAEELDMSQLYRGHLNDSHEHERYVKRRLEEYGETPSRIKDYTQRIAALGLGVTAKAMPDTPGKLAAVAFAFEHLEIASYEMLRIVAEQAGDEETVAMCDHILPVERQAADLISQNFHLAVDKSLEDVGVKS